MALLLKLGFVVGLATALPHAVAGENSSLGACGARTAHASLTGTTLKDFGLLSEAYAFFEQHATEIEKGLAAHVAIIESRFGTESRALNVLDFGCSTGNFIQRLFKSARPLMGNRSAITLVDRDGDALLAASRAMVGLVTLPTTGLRDFSNSTPGSYDLIIAKHVVHHIPEPLAAVAVLAKKLKPKDSLLLLTLASDRNGLNQMSYDGQRLMGQAPTPIAKVEMFRPLLTNLGFRHRVKRVVSKLRFPDSAVNRQHIARFVFGSAYTEETREILMGTMTQFQIQGEIVIPLDDEILVVEPK